MKKAVFLLSYLLFLAYLTVPVTAYSQGITAPGGTGAWGNMVYGGFGFTTPQPYSSTHSDVDNSNMIAAFGVGLGNPIKGLGVQLGSAMLDVSDQDVFNFGVKVHRYMGKGVSIGLGIENLFNVGPEGGDVESMYASPDVDFVSPYVAFTKDLRYVYAPSQFLSRISYSLGAGFGRFAKLSPADFDEHGRKNGTYAFAALKVKLAKRFDFHTEWNGTNLNAGISFNSRIEEVPFTILLSGADLTPYSGDGPRFIGAIGFAYQFKDPYAAKRCEEKKKQENMYNKMDDVDTQIQILEKEIEILKKKGGEGGLQGGGVQQSDAGYNDVVDASEFDSNVKNFKDDDIVTVEDGMVTNEDTESGYYVVIHSFREKARADKAVSTEKSKGVEAKYVYNKTRNWYYVYTHMYKNLKDALLKSTEQRDKGYEGAWVHIY